MSKEINKELLDEKDYIGYKDQQLCNQYWQEANKNIKNNNNEQSEKKRNRKDIQGA